MRKRTEAQGRCASGDTAGSGFRVKGSGFTVKGVSLIQGSRLNLQVGGWRVYLLVLKGERGSGQRQ